MTSITAGAGSSPTAAGRSAMTTAAGAGSSPTAAGRSAMTTAAGAMSMAAFSAAASPTTAATAAIGMGNSRGQQKRCTDGKKEIRSAQPQ